MKNLRKILIGLTVCALYSFTTVSASKPSFNDVAVHRIQLKVKTNTIKNSNTDSPVWVQLSTKDAPYYLNKSGNDREKGIIDSYEILSPNISTIGDINMIKMGIDGSDGWNFRFIELIINGISIYKKEFSQNGQWIDSNSTKHPNTYSITSSKLRSSRNWNYNNLTKDISSTPTSIPLSVIQATIESAVGNTLNSIDDVTWGKKYGKEYVSIKRINSNTLRVDLDLKAKVTGLPDAEVDVDFDLVFSCINGVIKTEIRNYASRSSGLSSSFAWLFQKIDGTMLIRCDIVGILTLTNGCSMGLNMIDEWFDFDFNYGSSAKNNSSNACSNKMRLDLKGNLHLNKRKSNTPVTGINKNKLKTTMMVSRFQSKN